MLIAKIVSPFFFLAMRIISFVIYLATILAAFGGRFNPEFFSLPALLCLAFPYLACATILLAVFWAFCKKIVACALAIVTIIICLTPLSVAFPLGSAREPSGENPVFKIMSWNVIHTLDLRQPDNPGNRAVDYMINSGADVIGLVEMKNFSDELAKTPKALKDSLFKTYPYRDGLNSTDIKILSKYPLSRLQRILKEENGNCRYDFFNIKFPGNRELIVGVVHLFSFGLSDEERQVVTEIKSVKSAKTSVKEFKGPIRSKMRSAFIKRAENATSLREVIDDIDPEIPLIICGDFNDVPTSWTYNIVKGDDMRDAYVETNFGPAITYNLHAFYFHIDQMLYRGDIEALDLTVGKINTSDHYPLIGEFQFTK